MNQYELAVLYHPDLEVDLSKAEQKLSKIIAEAEGKISKTETQGKRKLAYPIKGQDWAVYVFYTVMLPANGPQKVESALNITDEVIRYLLIKYDPKAEKAKQAKAEQKNEESEKPAKRDESKESKIKGGKEEKE